MIPPKEYAERAGAKYQTVMLWLRQNLIPGAQKFALPTGSHYYLVPADAPKPETRRGPKLKKETKRAGAPAIGDSEEVPSKPKRRASKKTPAKKVMKMIAKKKSKR